ncbi:hypothetical protein ACFQL1_23845 [Halomicroarcula sp. GCM10025709]|uniref:hypothetical protein n=1 Tax=Haloarcula TaxID=2237 RepID=UPI0024C26482|nr:hypothetical protein [Halomicroarcula sp. YJ-61-S]
MEEGEIQFYETSTDIKDKTSEVLVESAVTGIGTGDPFTELAVNTAQFAYEEWGQDSFYHWGPLDSTADKDETTYI